MLLKMIPTRVCLLKIKDQVDSVVYFATYSTQSYVKIQKFSWTFEESHLML